MTFLSSNSHISKSLGGVRVVQDREGARELQELARNRVSWAYWLWLLWMVAAEPTEKNLDVMRKFSEQYARRSGTYFCVDKGVTAVVIKVRQAEFDDIWIYFFPNFPCRVFHDLKSCLAVKFTMLQKNTISLAREG